MYNVYDITIYVYAEIREKPTPPYFNVQISSFKLTQQQRF